MNTSKMTVRQVYDWLDQVAPFDTQEEFDNAGLQVGLMDASVHGILLALDVVDSVIDEAISLGCNLIIAHHPLLFMPQSDMNLARHTPRLLARLIKTDIALIAAHTNIDQSSAYSASLVVAKLLDLRNIRQEGPYLFLGDLEPALSELDLKDRISDRLQVPARLYGGNGQPIRTLAVAGGAYSEGFAQAQAAGAQALLTGEVRHHHAVEAAALGMLLYDGGHFATEAPMLAPLASGLQSLADTLQCSVQVYEAQGAPYRLQ